MGASHALRFASRSLTLVALRVLPVVDGQLVFSNYRDIPELLCRCQNTHKQHVRTTIGIWVVTISLAFRYAITMCYTTIASLLLQ